MLKILNLLFIVGILIAVFFLSTYKLTESPRTWYDEGAIIQRAINFLRYGNIHYQVAPGEFSSGAFDSTGYPVIYPISLAFKFFGIGLLQARAVMVAFIMLFILISYFLIDRTYGFMYAAIAAMLLATFPPIYGNGKNVLGEIPGLFFLVTFLFSLYLLEKCNFRNKFFLILSGLAAGLCISTKPTFLVLLPAFIAVLFLFKRKDICNSDVLYYFFPAFSAPVILFLYTQYMPTDSLFKVFAYYRNPYNLTDLSSVIFHNFVRFFTEWTPIYFSLFFLVWLASFALRMKSDKNQVSLSEGTAFLFASFLFFAYLRTPGWYRYFFIAHVLALAYFPFSLSYLIEILSHSLPEKFSGLLSRRTRQTMTAVLFIAIISSQLYLLRFNSWVARYYDSVTTRTLSNYFNNFDSSKSVFFYDVPEIITFLPNEQYYQYLSMNDTGMYTTGADKIPVLIKGIPEIIIVSGNEENLERFTHYRLKDRVAGYLILERL